MNDIKSKTIMFSGGGTGGSVTPLLAIAAELLKDQVNFNLVFVGTKTGPERGLVNSFPTKKIKFLTIPSGKWRRYFSIYNFLDIFKIFSAFFKSLIILRQEQPDLVISAGSFVSVPLVLAAAFKKIPILIHQQDIRPGLANKLMAPFARVITVTFERSLADYGPRAVLTGNPLRDTDVAKVNGLETRKKYNLKIDIPLVLIIGGGTGATAVNDLITEISEELISFCQIIHLTGTGKRIKTEIKNNNYQTFEFLDHEEILNLMGAADLVVSRCGLGVLTELAALDKAAILIPMPHSHQEDNAKVFADRAAAVVLSQDKLEAGKLLLKIQEVLSDPKLRGSLSRNIGKIMKPEAAQNIVALIWEIIKTKQKLNEK